MVMEEKHMTEGGLARLKSRGAYLLYGLILGALLILAVRYFTYQPMEHAHYHANFAVYINGQQESFKDSKYYQEVKLCALHGTTPAARVHMHDETPGVIHVHDEAVTWGAFFENLGWIVGPDFIRTSDTLYTSSDTAGLHVVLNGQDLTGLSTITNQVIDDRDRLLISFGSADQATLDTEYKSVPNNAAKYDTTPDPASCQGAEKVTATERLKHLF